jgi:predicted transcriptional regulator of viral defense system
MAGSTLAPNLPKLRIGPARFVSNPTTIAHLSILPYFGLTDLPISVMVAAPTLGHELASREF